MPDDNESGRSDSASAADACPLSRPEQTRNMLLFGACVGLVYLTAPVSYVGVTQAPLCKNLGASEVVANLPLSIYMGTTIFPLLIAWRFPKVSQLKPTLICCFATLAASTAVVPLCLASPLRDSLKIAVVVLHAAVLGVANPTAFVLMWEALGRGVEASRRGWALALAFGAGPVLAAVASFGSQLLLKGSVGSFRLTGLQFPWNFIALYGAVAPLMAVAAVLSSRFVVPPAEVERQRAPFFEGIFGGLWDFLTDRLLLTTTIVIILVYNGNAISSNMSLYSSHVLGGNPEDYSGINNTLRFGFKAVMGLLLGWLATRSHPKAGLLVTSSMYVISQVWAICASGRGYLLAFGIFGMGELIGVYAPNYILAASRKGEIRRNQAFHTLMMMPASLAAVLFGWIAERVGASHGAAVGFQASFATCAALMTLGILLAIWKLPAQPRPTERE